jgi:hypothetical protein
MKPSAGRYELILCVLLIVAAGVVLWFHFLPEKPPAGQLTHARVADQVQGTGKQTVACKDVEVYKPKAKQELDLPAAEQDDNNVHVLAASRVSPDVRPVTVITTFNSATGKSETRQRREDYPLLAAENTGEARLDYGFSGGIPVIRGAISENLLQVGAVHIGVSAAIDTGGHLFAGGGLGYRW